MEIGCRGCRGRSADAAAETTASPCRPPASAVFACFSAKSELPRPSCRAARLHEDGRRCASWPGSGPDPTIKSRLLNRDGFCSDPAAGWVACRDVRDPLHNVIGKTTAGLGVSGVVLVGLGRTVPDRQRRDWVAISNLGAPGWLLINPKQVRGGWVQGNACWNSGLFHYPMANATEDGTSLPRKGRRDVAALGEVCTSRARRWFDPRGCTIPASWWPEGKDEASKETPRVLGPGMYGGVAVNAHGTGCACFPVPLPHLPAKPKHLPLGKRG